MNATVQKWGNSLALRIPRSMSKDAHFERGTVVEVSLARGALVVRAVAPPSYSLTRLLKGITRTNRHRESDWGPARGREAW